MMLCREHSANINIQPQETSDHKTSIVGGAAARLIAGQRWNVLGRTGWSVLGRTGWSVVKASRTPAAPSLSTTA